jgi:hypothetical protein
MIERLAALARPVLDKPYVKRTRRNHGLEHATVHLLTRRLKQTPMMGRSYDGGFVLFVDAPQEMVEAAAHEALRRMKGGEHALAVHPGCGTSRLTSGFMASMVAVVGLSGTNRRDAFNRLPAMLTAMMFALLVAEPLGQDLQRHFTTDGNPGDMEITGITGRQIPLPGGGHTWMYTVRTQST